MKLLSWMRTIKQNGVDPSKEFKGDFCCLRAQVSSEVQDIRTNSFSFSFSGPSHDPNPPELDDELRFDKNGFSGFLAIGTLGRDPETPKFAALVAEEDVAGAQKEMAKLITEKLDKFLEEYPEDTSSKRVQRSNAEGDRESDVRPTQGYDLFRSSIELTKRSNKVKKKKGLLTSLFKRRKTVEGECNSMEKHGTGDLIKRICAKLHGSSTKKRNDDDAVDSTPKKKDLRKSVQILRSKVHPVLYAPAAREDNKIDGRRSCINRCDLNIPNLNEGFLVSSSISEGNRKGENWIKTDAEYLVLEL
ncbi:hypothetical protein EUTSA_v10004671mg [Eutrema salsugineum]|uniref:Protein LAZY 1 n=1 Tax=Eutrema salsugineum TaxID=72664 RepID=V4KRY9_EUTSA|nr:protein LAZY 1 [Eutrema salsugineum]ESQ32777.1 hypothetical protein EUTSA_v10004671mg [Eutrema salsugineum]